MTLDVHQSPIVLKPDPSRVIARLFVAGREDVGPGDSRATEVIGRILALSDEAVDVAMRDLDDRFETRHRDLHDTFRSNADLIRPRRNGQPAISDARQLLIGAAFTHEYAIEGAALCNPSAVLHPQQDTTGDVRFVMSVRGIGEGHRSSIGFRTGTLAPDGTVSIDEPGRFPTTALAGSASNHRSVFNAKLSDLDDRRVHPRGAAGEVRESRARPAHRGSRHAGRNPAPRLVDHRAPPRIARSSYLAEFADTTDLSERVLWPLSPAEAHGMEDARFVRFVDDDGGVTYYATYTAFDGTNIAQHLLETVDFQQFVASPVGGDAAVGKGLALFPRKVGGRFVALSRSDRETNAIAFSEDLHCWNAADTIQVPDRTWEILQLGNCGSPIETEAGWLVLTHGVGPMRTYSLGAILLDLDEPHRVIAGSEHPIITPIDGRRDGYVPNVVYSCGGFAHNDTLVIPYGIADQNISFATLSISELLGTLKPGP